MLDQHKEDRTYESVSSILLQCRKILSEVLQGVLVAEAMCLSLRFVLNLPAAEFNVNRGK